MEEAFVEDLLALDLPSPDEVGSNLEAQLYEIKTQLNRIEAKVDAHLLQCRYHLQRAPRACEPCRRRKIKCGREAQGCGECARLGKQCLYLPKQ